MDSGYLVRRLVVGIGTLLAAVSLVFLMIHLIPGDPVRAILGDLYNPTTAEQLTTQLGLDKPLVQQYVDFMSRLARGDLGTSFLNRQPVLQVVLENLHFTVQLAMVGILVTIALGIPAGIIAALHRGKFADMLMMSASLLGASMPSFWLGILLMIVFAVNLKWFPLMGTGDADGPLGLIKALVLPGVTLGLRGAALTARVTRSSMLENLGPGLHPDGARERAQRTGRHLPPRLTQCAPARGHRRRHRSGTDARRCCHRRDRLQSTGAWHPARQCRPRSRLSAHPGHVRRLPDADHPGEPGGRSGVRAD